MSESTQRLNDAINKVNDAADRLKDFVDMHKKWIPICLAAIMVAAAVYGIATDSHFHLHSHDADSG